MVADIQSFLLPSLYDIIGIVAFIISLFAFRIGRKPRYIIKDTELISRQQVGQHIPDLQILHKNIPVNKVTLTELLLWNSGWTEIKGADFASKNPLRVSVTSQSQSDGKILQIKMASTFLHNDVKLDVSNEGKVVICLDHLAHADGFALEILHSGELVLEGIMTNGKVPRKVEEPPGCAAFILMIATLIIGTVTLVAESFSLLLSTILCLVATLYLFNARPHPRKFRSFMETRKMVAVARDNSTSSSLLSASPAPSTESPLIPTTDQVRQSNEILVAAQTTAQGLRQSAQDAIRAEEFTGAADNLAQACALSPGESILFLEAGILALRCERNTEAEALLVQGMNLPTADESLLFVFAFARGIAAKLAGRDDARALSAMKQFVFTKVSTNHLKLLIGPISALDQATQPFYKTLLADMRKGHIDRVGLSKYRPTVPPLGLDKPWTE